LTRANSDHVTDSHGRRILDSCKVTDLRIGNGRLHNDIHGELTFHSHNGTSPLDYLLLNSNDFQHISHFQIDNVSEFSDHCGLSFSIRGRANMKIQPNGT